MTSIVKFFKTSLKWKQTIYNSFMDDGTDLDKDTEDVIKSNFKSYRPYIESCVKTTDLVRHKINLAWNCGIKLSFFTDSCRLFINSCM